MFFHAWGLTPENQIGKHNFERHIQRQSVKEKKQLLEASKQSYTWISENKIQVLCEGTKSKELRKTEVNCEPDLLTLFS